MALRRFILTIPALFTLAFGQQSTTTVTQTYSFPVLGLASSETAQISVVNLSSSASCSGTINFMNSSGAAIGSATPYNNLTGGQIFSATLPGAAGSRQVFRGVVTLDQVFVVDLPPCNLGASLETYDTVSGVTHAVLAQVQQAVQGPIVRGPIVLPFSAASGAPRH